MLVDPLGEGLLLDGVALICGKIKERKTRINFENPVIAYLGKAI